MMNRIGRPTQATAEISKILLGMRRHEPLLEVYGKTAADASRIPGFLSMSRRCLPNRLSHRALQFGQAAVVVGNRLIVHFTLRIELAFGVQ